MSKRTVHQPYFISRFQSWIFLWYIRWDEKIYDRSYRLVHKYIHQPRLIKLSKTNRDGNCLSSGIVSIALPCLCLLLELAAPKPEIRYSILVDPDRSTSLAGTQKTGLRQPPESVRVFFDCRKQVEVTGGQIRWIGWVWYAANVVFFKPICWSSTCMNWAIVEMNH
jgi:hypothetical protein